MTRLVAILVSTFSLIVAFPTWADPKRPNVVLILADDLGFSDIAPYGSEIATPSITALAEEGVRFTNYHTAASCAPSRAMLLTGVDSHRAGVPNIPEMLPPEHSERSGSKGTLGRNVVTVATLLQDAGYHTYIAGKWHLGMTPDLLPSQRGFEKTFVLADSGADNWEQKPYLPIYDKANWFADGRPRTSSPCRRSADKASVPNCPHRCRRARRSFRTRVGSGAGRVSCPDATFQRCRCGIRHPAGVSLR